MLLKALLMRDIADRPNPAADSSLGIDVGHVDNAHVSQPRARIWNFGLEFDPLACQHTIDVRVNNSERFLPHNLHDRFADNQFGRLPEEGGASFVHKKIPMVSTAPGKQCLRLSRYAFELQLLVDQQLLRLNA